MTDLIASNEIQTGSIYQQQTVGSIINNNNNNTDNKNNNSKNKFVIIIENDLVGEIQFEKERYLHKKFKKIASSNDAGQENEDFHNTGLPKDVAVEEVDSEFDPTSTINLESLNELRKSGYICPYCKLSCAKPSVLQKHIRAHTNERPYPCMPCGFAFKTRSNLYKHCRSRAHVSKMEGANIKVHSESFSSCSNTSLKQSHIANSPEPSDDSDPSLSDTASTTSTNVPSPNTPNVTPSRIYKPKFHTVLQQCKTDVTSHYKKNISDRTQQHIQFFIDDQNLIDTSNTQSQALLHSHNGKSSMNHDAEVESRKRTYREGSQSLVQDFQQNVQPISKYENHEITVPLASPGPLLGSTRLIDEPKRARLEMNLNSVDENMHQPRINVLQMFGGEVRIIAASGETKTMRVQTGPHQQKNKQKYTSFECNNVTSILSSSLSETASVLVQSGLQSGGTILRKQQANSAMLDDPLDFGRIPDNVSITPHIETPKFAPTLEAAYPKPTSIIHAGRLIPFVPGIPGPQSLSPLPIENEEHNTPSLAGPIYSSVSKIRQIHTSDANSHDTISNKFLRPSTLPLKPGTFTPKRHHGITPTANTLVLISPETPRPKKSYGQLYLNGHAYTYLGLKCSTRLFYCTLNKPQPMYVLQQQGLSMYSNWKVCKETSPELEFQYYDSRNRSHSYTLASTCNQDILTHSSQRSVTPTTPDSGLENDSLDKTKRVRIFDGGFESNEDYTYIRGRGRGRYVCEECGIRCKKPSMLKKHIRTHTDVRPYTCKYCTFSFKTKGNLTKHMKSKAHYKKCVELRVIPVPTSVRDENIDKEALKQLVLNGTSTEDTSSSDDESEADVEPDSDESGNEEHEAAQSLLRLATRPRASHIAFTSEHSKVLGILTSSRPVAYPYGQSKINETDNIKCTLSVHTPIDLTISKTLKYSSPKSNTTDILGSPVSGSKFLQTLVQTMKRLPIQNSNWQVAAVSQDQMFQAYLTERHLMNSKLKQHCRVAVPSIKPITSEIVAEIEHRKTFESESDHENYKLKSFEQLNLASMLPARKVVVNKMGLTASSPKQSTEFFQPSLGEESKNICSVCSKVFNKPSQLRLHINIHYFERPFRCESCGTSFRTKGHLTKHERSTLHHNKVNMTSTFGAATASNPRPFKCLDCKSAFRIHGHLAKHLRSKMHIMKLECLRKLPFGTYAEMEKSGVNLNDIDTTDCDTSLSSLQVMAQRLYKKEPDLLNQWETNVISSNSTITPADISNFSLKSNEASESSSDEGGKDRTTSFHSEIEYPCYLLNVCKSSKLEDIRTQKSMVSHTTLPNLGELKLHCFEEGCVESNTTSPVFCHNVPVSLKNIEDNVINKENTQRLTIVRRAAIKKSP